MKKIILLSTGGTIAMRTAPNGCGLVPALTGEDLVSAVPELASLPPIEVIPFSNIPSPHMTPPRMLALAEEADRLASREDVLGIVITHGTDTMEESAYLADLTVQTDKPICFTAAMRSSEQSSPDGPHNILCAVRAAASPELIGCGVLVVMNEEIHTARAVTKTHTANPKTFASPFRGPIGYADEDRIIRYHHPIPSPKFRLDAITAEVPIVKVATGQGDLLLRAVIERGADGIVLEGFGRGNIPPDLMPAVRDALAADIPVVVTSRVFGGRTLGVYGYEGGGGDLKASGAILAGELSSQKARLLLLCSLSAGMPKEQIPNLFG